jgi:hypothetical protein
MTGLAGRLASGRRRKLESRAAGLRKAYGDRLLRRARAVLSFPHMVDLLADEFARLRGGRLTCARFSTRAFDGAFFGHGVSYLYVS